MDCEMEMKTRFETPMIVELVRGTDLGDMPFRLHADARYRTDCIPGQSQIDMLKGSRTNFANIPRFCWRIFGPPSGWYRDAAVVHDELCPDKAGKKIPCCSSDQAANVLKEACLDIVEFSEWGRFKCWRRRRMASMMRFAVAHFGPQFQGPPITAQC